MNHVERLRFYRNSIETYWEPEEMLQSCASDGEHARTQAVLGPLFDRYWLELEDKLGESIEHIVVDLDVISFSVVLFTAGKSLDSGNYLPPELRASLRQVDDESLNYCESHFIVLRRPTAHQLAAACVVQEKKSRTPARARPLLSGFPRSHKQGQSQ